MKIETLRLEHVSLRDEDMPYLDISFNVYQNELLGIWLPNQTRCRCLIDLLIGKETDFEGDIFINDKKQDKISFRPSHNQDIRCIRSHPTLAPNMSVAENLFISKKEFYPKGIYKHSLMCYAAQNWLNYFGLSELTPKTLVNKLDIAHAHIIEIIRAIINDASVILFDNITRFYSDKQYDILAEFLQKIKNNSDIRQSFLFFVDSYTNIFSLLDRAIVTHHGRAIANMPANEFSSELIRERLRYPASESFSTEKAAPSEMFRVSRSALEKENSLYLFHIDAGSLFCIFDRDQVFSDLSVKTFKQSKLFHNLQIDLEGKLLDGKKLLKSYGVEVCLLNCHYISDSISRNLNIYQNVTMRMKRPAFGLLGFEHKKLTQYSARKFLDKIYADQVFKENMKDVLPADLSYLQHFVILLARFLASGAKLLVIVDPQICFDETQYGLFLLMIKEVIQSGVAVIVISSTENILMLLSEEENPE